MPLRRNLIEDVRAAVLLVALALVAYTVGTWYLLHVLADKPVLPMLPAERLAAQMASVAMATACLSRATKMVVALFHGFTPSNASLVVLAVQAIAAVSNGLMGALESPPIVLDEMTSGRVHVLRSSEWGVCAFALIFLVEALDANSLALPTLLALAQSVSCSCLAVLPFTRGVFAWQAVMGLSCGLFALLFVQLRRRLRTGLDKPSGSTSRALVELKQQQLARQLLFTCVITWCIFPLVYFVAWGHQRWARPKGAEAPAWPFIVDCVLDSVAKILYSILVVEVSDTSPVVLALMKARVERVEMQMAWEQSGDVIVVLQLDKPGMLQTRASPSLNRLLGDSDAKCWVEGRVHSLLQSVLPSSPLELKAAQLERGTSLERVQDEEISASFDAASDESDESDLHLSEQQIQPSQFSYRIARSETEGEDFEHVLNRAWRALGLVQVGQSIRLSCALRTHRLPNHSPLTLRRHELTGKAGAYLAALCAQIGGAESEAASTTYILCCEVDAKLSAEANQTAVVVLRDISERTHSQKIERALAASAIARKKDEEASHFTRHCVKNDILAAISASDTLSRIHRATLGPDAASSDAAPEVSAPAGDEQHAGIAASRVALLHSEFVAAAAELRQSLAHTLETVLAAATAREVVHGMYRPEPEPSRVDVLLNPSPDRRAQGSTGGTVDSGSCGRLSLSCEPTPMPQLELDPRLLSLVHRNALSNAMRFGAKGAHVSTLVKFELAGSAERKTDPRAGYLEVVVQNVPGEGWERLHALNADEVCALVFRNRVGASGSKSGGGGWDAAAHSTQSEAGLTTPEPTPEKSSMRGQVRASRGQSEVGGGWMMHQCAVAMGGSVNIDFGNTFTRLRLRFPVRLHVAELAADLFQLPEDVLAIGIDDSPMQRALLARMLKTLGAPKSRSHVMGATADDIIGFVPFVLGLIAQSPRGRLLLIVDENLDMIEPGGVCTYSGSEAVLAIRKALSAQDEARVLACIRSANDAQSDVELYLTRAHSFVGKKAAFSKESVTESFKAIWLQRFGSTDAQPAAAGGNMMCWEDFRFNDDDDAPQPASAPSSTLPVRRQLKASPSVKRARA